MKHIVIDLDNTIICEAGETIRPGMFELLDSFKANNLKLSIWTASTNARAEPIIHNLGLAGYFASFVYRDDYDPDSKYGCTQSKDIRFGNGDMLIDDSHRHCKFVESIGLKAFHIKPFFSLGDRYNNEYYEELEQLHKFVLPGIPFSIERESWLTGKINRIFKKKKPLPVWLRQS
jgi:hydroxymethylpyrimidine pyrophosphatase-like HAD family hydrolase